MYGEERSIYSYGRDLKFLLTFLRRGYKTFSDFPSCDSEDTGSIVTLLNNVLLDPRGTLIRPLKGLLGALHVLATEY